MATPAKTCKQALADATARWPRRNKASDGIMGDTRHQKRKSDHNDGNAYDLTHDPGKGVDCNVLSRQVINDARVTYVIWDRKIYNRSRAAEGWRRYTGQNPHTHHMHVSIRAASRDDLSPWPWSNGGTTETTPTSISFPGKALRQRSQGADVRIVQGRLVAHGHNVAVDGNFGSGTRAAVIAFQEQKGLTADGVVGPKTWDALMAD